MRISSQLSRLILQQPQSRRRRLPRARAPRRSPASAEARWGRTGRRRTRTAPPPARGGCAAGALSATHRIETRGAAIGGARAAPPLPSHDRWRAVHRARSPRPLAPRCLPAPPPPVAWRRAAPLPHPPAAASSSCCCSAPPVSGAAAGPGSAGGGVGGVGVTRLRAAAGGAAGCTGPGGRGAASARRRLPPPRRCQPRKGSGGRGALRWPSRDPVAVVAAGERGGGRPDARPRPGG